MVNVKIFGGEYDLWIALKKLGKRALVFLLPSFIAYQSSVDPAYAWLLSGVIFMIQNYVQNK